MYAVEKVIAEANGIRLPDEMGLRFNEPDYPMAVQDQIAMDGFMLQNNLITQKDLLLKYNKHLTEEEADKILNENKEVNGEGQQTENQERSVFNRLLEQTPEAE
jgi:hypothetical protein